MTLQKVLVFAVSRQQRKLVVHKADIERCVMDHQLRAADIVHESIGYFGKRGLIEQKFIGNTMYAKGFRIHQPIGF